SHPVNWRRALEVADSALEAADSVIEVADFAIEVAHFALATRHGRCAMRRPTTSAPQREELSRGRLSASSWFSIFGNQRHTVLDRGINVSVPRFFTPAS